MDNNLFYQSTSWCMTSDGVQHLIKIMLNDKSMSVLLLYHLVESRTITKFNKKQLKEIIATSLEVIRSKELSKFLGELLTRMKDNDHVFIDMVEMKRLMQLEVELYSFEEIVLISNNLNSIFFS